MNFLSLFSGIGGLDLGLERAGMRCVGQVEINEFCRRVLAKHWPDVSRFDDVRTFDPKQINERIDLIAGGFPCQDISEAGKRVGLKGRRSGLWVEFLRIIREVRPAYVLVENVSDLLIRGIGTVLSDLAECGFDAEWQVLSASAFGAPHPRERVFIVGLARWSVANADRSTRREARGGYGPAPSSRRLSQAGPTDIRDDVPAPIVFTTDRAPASKGWAAEPDVRRVGNGIPNRVERVTALGNAVVPQVAELIGRAILAVHAARESEAA